MWLGTLIIVSIPLYCNLSKQCINTNIPIINECQEYKCLYIGRYVILPFILKNLK